MRKLLFLFLLISIKGISQKQYDIYYLSIGSGYYEPLGKEPKGKLPDVTAAISSSKLMTKLFDSLGAKSGITLLSTKKKVVTKEEVMTNVDRIIKDAKKGKNPFIVFYYCGHGFTSGKLKAHFITTGEFFHDTEEFEHEDWLEYALPPLDIREKLSASKIPYMMLIDTCYSGNLENPERLTQSEIDAFGLKKMDDLMGDTYNILIALNQMLGPDPVIFSANAGTPALTLNYKFEDGKTREVGPICRKAHIVMNTKFKNIDKVSVKEFTVNMLDKEIDPETSSINSAWVFDAQNLNYIRY